MKQIKEMWNLVFEWLGNGKKAIMGLGFLAIGIIVNCIINPAQGITQSTFLLLMIGALLLVNALCSKLAKCNIHAFYYILVFVAIIELAIYLMEEVEMDLSGILSVGGPCFVFVWALQYIVLLANEMESTTKRIVIAFFVSLAGLLAVACAFFIPILIAA